MTSYITRSDIPKFDGPIKLVCVFRSKEGMSWEEFNKYWEHNHGPLVASKAAALGIKRYIQSPAYKTAMGETFNTPRGWTLHERYDALTEIWWQSTADALAHFATEEGKLANAALIEDESRFAEMNQTVCWVTQERPIVGQLSPV